MSEKNTKQDSMTEYVFKTLRKLRDAQRRIELMMPILDEAIKMTQSLAVALEKVDEK